MFLCISLCNFCKLRFGFVILVYPYIVVQNTTYRGHLFVGLQDSATTDIFQGKEMGCLWISGGLKKTVSDH